MARTSDPRADPVGPVDLFDDAGARTGGDPVRRGSRPHAPAGRAVPLGDLGDDVELLPDRQLGAAELGGTADVEDARGVQVGDGLVRVTTRALRLQGTLPQRGPERADLLEDPSLSVRRSVSWSSTCVSAPASVGCRSVGRRVASPVPVGCPWRSATPARSAAGGSWGGRGRCGRCWSRRRGSSRRRRERGCLPASRAGCRSAAGSPCGSRALLGLSPTSMATISSGFSGCVVGLEVGVHRPVVGRPALVEGAVRHLQQAVPGRVDVRRVDRRHEALVADLPVVLVDARAGRRRRPCRCWWTTPTARPSCSRPGPCPRSSAR